MDPILLFAESWWWVAPVAATAGAGAYGALTTKRRRARRLELDAARLEESRSRRELHHASLHVKTAKADVLAAKAQAGATTSPALVEARRALAVARDGHRASALALRAARGRVKASSIRYRTMARDAPLPVEELVSRHDAVTARWLVYETDAAMALSFPQMLDSQHPATLAFLRANRDATQLRGRVTQGDVSPETFLAFRNAVHDAEVRFDLAEADARGEVRERMSGLSWTAMTPLTGWIPRAADAIEYAARVVGEVRDMGGGRRNPPPPPTGG